MERTSGCPSSSVPCENPDETSRKRKRTTPPTACYQVFINHRGPDVKTTLASLIYQWLQGKGLQAFLDRDEFQPGQPLKSTIEEAIRASSVHVAIFSKRYAESNWCLDELCLMLETGAPIISVFYLVGPSDLRWIEKGEYASAFAEHERKGRFDSKIISAWKLALKEVAGISGLEIGDQWDWGQLLKSLEDAVFRNLNPKPAPLHVAEDPVGLDEAIRDFETFVECVQQKENEKVRIVGIVGLGGSGKTTLAKEFFNRKRPSFQNSSFLFDVRDASSKNALPGLQSKLLQDLLGVQDRKIYNVSEGKRMIREGLQSLTVSMLIVLDDIDHSSQIEALLEKDVLGSGSLIIITSRNEEALKLSEASIYKIKALSSEHARDLFCKYAFQQPCPRVGFESLVKKFCERCGGLPLFLKVMGAHLRVNAGNDRELWEDELKYIPEEILHILEISYNALSKGEKQIFLDIACFFLGEDKNLATKVWDTCEGRGLLRLNALVNKCLVEFDFENCLKMHDHVRDFGREMAHKESPCRLWNESQAANFREQPEATKEFRGIMAATPPQPFGFRCSSSYKPPLEEIELLALKILAISGDCLDEQIGRKLKNLVWLRWFECPHTNISPWLIPMKNLTVLELFGGKIEEWPLRGEQVHLRELRSVATNLSMIPISQDACPSLVYLDLRCSRELIKIEHLPQKLVKLHLTGCANLVELQGLEHLPQLRDLDISHCSALCEVPKLQHLLSLEILNASHCSNLQHLQGLEQLRKIRIVDIEGCSELCELPKLQHLPSLEELLAFRCAKLQRIQGLEHLPQLRELQMSECTGLRELPKLQQLPSLEMLRVDTCDSLQRIQGLEDLPQLQVLEIYECSELRELPKLQQLPSLETLRVDTCDSLQHIQGLEHLPQLGNVYISECHGLRELPKLQQLPSLETLRVYACASLQHIQGLEHLPQLRKLKMSECTELRELPKLQQLPSLETLTVRACDSLQRIEGLEDLPQLQVLEICQCSEFQEFPSLAQLTSLEEVESDGCRKVHGIQGLDQLEKLKSLRLSSGDNRTIWNAIEHIKKLPRRTCLRAARAEVNSLDMANLSVIDLNIHHYTLNGYFRTWELPACPTSFMLCFVVQFSTMQGFPPCFHVVVYDRNGGIVDWVTRVEGKGEWVYTVICSRECNSMEYLYNNEECFY